MLINDHREMVAWIDKDRIGYAFRNPPLLPFCITWVALKHFASGAEFYPRFLQYACKEYVNQRMYSCLATGVHNYLDTNRKRSE